MTAINILKQSFNFYTRLFNKIFWLSVASSVIPLIHASVFGDEAPSMIGVLIIMGVSWFFSVAMMALIHQFSIEQNESLQSAFSLTLKKLGPVILTNFALGILIFLIMIPAVLVGSILSAGIADENLKNTVMAVVVGIPVILAVYHCFLSSYFTLVDDLNPIEAIKSSYYQSKKNKLYFNGVMILVLGFGLYFIILNLLKLMIGVNPLILGLFEFSLSVFVLPLFSVFIYRLFILTKKPELPDEEL